VVVLYLALEVEVADIQMVLDMRHGLVADGMLYLLPLAQFPRPYNRPNHPSMKPATTTQLTYFSHM
jgi:hypothetical protein